MSSSSLSDATALAAKLSNEHVADVVEALNGLEPGLAAEVLAKMPIERAAHVLGQPGFDRPQKLVERLPIECAAAILAATDVYSGAGVAASDDRTLLVLRVTDHESSDFSKLPIIY